METRIRQTSVTGRQGNKRILMWLGIIILLGCEAFFFRNVLFSDTLLGDSWDGRLTMLFTEHWYHVFRGEAAITDMGFFYPAANTLAYSDIFLSFGLIHSLLRFLGLDIYDAFKYTQIIIHLIGTVAAFRLLYKELKTDFWWALFGTIAFSFSSTYSWQISHAQMMAVSLVPLLAIFIVRFFKHFDKPARRRRAAVAAVLVLALILYTAWYVFFFTVLFIATSIVIWAIRAVVYRKELNFGISFRQIKGIIPEIIIYCITLVLLMIPFALLELPILRMSGGRTYGEVWGALPEAVDFINVSDENWLIGPVLREMKLGDRGYTYEVMEGFSISLILVFIWSWVVLRNRNRRQLPANTRDHSFLTITLAMATVTSCILCMRLSSNGISLWWIIFHIFPGATSIRAVARYLLFLSFPLAVAAALMGNAATSRLKKRPIVYSALMIGLVILTFLSCIRTGGVFARWTKSGSEAFLFNVPAPPEDCEVFFLSDVIEGESGPYYQLDAYQIADKYGVKTIHGYSGLNPPGWGDMWDVHGPNYSRTVKNWILDNKLENVYAYDEVKGTWTRFDPQDESVPMFDASAKIIPEMVSGIWDIMPEGDYSWTMQDVKIQICNKEITEKGLKIKIGTTKERYLKQNPNLEPVCFIYVNGKQIADLEVSDDVKEYFFQVEKAEGDLYEIELKTNCYFVPAEIGENGDGRELALKLYYIGPINE